MENPKPQLPKPAPRLVSQPAPHIAQVPPPPIAAIAASDTCESEKEGIIATALDFIALIASIAFATLITLAYLQLNGN